MTREPLADQITPIEIRVGVFVRIHGIPLDMTQAEARKIGAVVLALAAEPARLLDHKSSRTAAGPANGLTPKTPGETL